MSSEWLFFENGSCYPLPNIVDNYQYLKSYIKVENGGYFENMLNGSLILGDKNIVIFKSHKATDEFLEKLKIAE